MFASQVSYDITYRVGGGLVRDRPRQPLNAGRLARLAD